MYFPALSGACDEIFLCLKQHCTNTGIKFCKKNTITGISVIVKYFISQVIGWVYLVIWYSLIICRMVFSSFTGVKRRSFDFFSGCFTVIHSFKINVFLMLCNILLYCYTTVNSFLKILYNKIVTLKNGIDFIIYPVCLFYGRINLSISSTN